MVDPERPECPETTVTTRDASRHGFESEVSCDDPLQLTCQQSVR